ncbi:MAG: hypothetical protein KQJ78_08735 [Deltaproteobacteria bacterium]|nr:hypothetical protein [Deltaproteobacteria bacterium]
MALKAVLESLDAVAPEFRDLYREAGGRYLLQVEGAEKLADSGGWREALAKERARARELEDRLAAWASGAEPAPAGGEAPGEPGGWKSEKARLVRRQAQILKARHQETARLRAALEQELIDTEAQRAITRAGGSPELLLPHVRQRLKVFEEEGRFVVRPVDQSGEPRLGADGRPWSGAGDLLEELRRSEGFAPAFGVGAPVGSGSPIGRAATGVGAGAAPAWDLAGRYQRAAQAGDALAMISLKRQMHENK